MPSQPSGPTEEQPGNPYTFQRSSGLSTRALLSADNRTTSSTSAAEPPSLPLTPNTRSEAEAALYSNSIRQTESAAPVFRSAGGGDAASDDPEPSSPLGTRPPVEGQNSTNYVNAVAAAAAGQGAVAPLPSDTAGAPRRTSLARQQSWNAEEMRRMMSERLMQESGPPAGGAGYTSVAPGGASGQQ